MFKEFEDSGNQDRRHWALRSGQGCDALSWAEFFLRRRPESPNSQMAGWAGAKKRRSTSCCGMRHEGVGLHSRNHLSHVQSIGLARHRAVKGSEPSQERLGAACPGGEIGSA